MKKIYIFRGQYGKSRPPEPKNGNYGPKSVWSGRVIYPSIGNFTWSKKKYTFGGQKSENNPIEARNRIWSPKSILS
jgi:hypothetical protein